jgi:hypothetical protein
MGKGTSCKKESNTEQIKPTTKKTDEKETNEQQK